MARNRLSQFNPLMAGALMLCLAAPLWAQAPPDNKPRPAEKTEAARPKDARALFTPQEQQLIIYGLGNPIAQLLMMRELDRRWPLLPRQRLDLQNLNREAAPRLTELRAQRGRQERALEEAIYGVNFDAATVEALADESATTQQELMKLQGATEFRLLQILARGNPRRARTARAFVELLVQAPPHRPLPQLALARPNNGSLRFVAEFFADDWEMIVPGFGNPASFLLILHQLELTPEQKTAFKTLAQSVRVELQAELAERNKQQNNPNAQPREAGESDETETPDALPPSRQAMVEQVIANNAARQARQMKRQARIETRIRQTLLPKQWDAYVTLLRGLAGAGLNWTLPNGAQKNRMRQPNAPRLQPVPPETH